MAYILHVHLHPLGVIVWNEQGGRELIIEGETCCGIEFDDLKKIAYTSGKVEVEDTVASQCRLLRPLRCR